MIWYNTLRLRQNGRHFPDAIFKCNLIPPLKNSTATHIYGGGGDLLFLVNFCHRCHHHRCSANTFHFSGKKHQANFFKPHMVNLWVLENFLVPISVTLGQGHQATEAGQILPCPHDKVRTTHPIFTKLGRDITPVMLSSLSNFGGILSETVF